MTSTLDRSPAAPLRGDRPAPDGRRRVSSWRSRLGDALWLLPPLLLGLLVNAANLGGSPQRIDDEGTYAAQAWSIGNLGELTHYTYWYDHPPLGWIQIAAWAGLTDAWNRYDVAVIAAREAMLVASAIAAVLLWFLVRRIGFARLTASVSVALFLLSPLAVQFHHQVYLDNIATAWLLAALLLALSRRAQLAGYIGAAAAFGVAVLTKETYLLALPLVAWFIWRGADRTTRRYTLSVAAAVLGLIGLTYVALAAVKGEVMPAAGRVSLWDGLAFQLASREGSGSLFDPESLMSRTVGLWWQLDAVLIVTALSAAVTGLFVRRLRPWAVALLALTAFMFRGGYLPVPYVIMLLPFAAIVVAGMGQVAVEALRAHGVPRRLGGVAVASGLVVAVIAAGPLWAAQLRGFLLADLDRPLRDAEAWMTQNAPADSRMLVDDAMWVDLVRAGFERENVVWYYKADTDSDVQELAPDGWRDYDYVITTDSMRTFPTEFPTVRQAIENSAVVASFGDGAQKVDVRLVDTDQAALAQAADDGLYAARSVAGQQVLRNPDIGVPAEEQDLLTSGVVDGRILLTLGQLSAAGRVDVADIAQLDGDPSGVHRQLVISSYAGQDARADAAGADALLSFYESLTGSLRPVSVERSDAGVVITFSPDEPVDLLPRPAG
ncbi:Dolichyl-phosphate-mannose-protein mannosyltransferase [Microbacterium sp. ru370.1]|uniref:ArnT family glycosyltransferase n=1 Tax=unclassified Microbacterium TaxID=2609290 RepID=UPI00088A9096|nr:MULTISPECIES: glycosyltransferase family 39 protein [unclassified Microbacterium]SDO28656.1 Dolichyl-phosphate-mannose-protein mannosyltransferase [Microbacterium sp. ru370.1]SIT75279.1 Dolichyl-phosphate-mannose-protein mannosyltransferase [Microbacterium sp. RU1D]